MAKRSAVEEPGAYLTDGKRLFRVVDSAQHEVRLENCRFPAEQPVWRRVSEVLREMRLVRVSRS